MNISIEKLTFAYPTGVAALQGVSLEIGAGENVAIIGQNGAGKTTLVKHFNGLLKPSSGAVTIGDWDTRQYSTARLAARVGYVFQNPDDQLFQATVIKEIEFGPKKLGWPPEKITAQVKLALDLTGLANHAHQHPYDLSPGERKRVALAAVLAMDTPIIILDEPTTAQDFAGVKLIAEINRWLKAQGRTVVTITHDIDFCGENFERVIVMANGQVLVDDNARAALSQTTILAQAAVEPPQLVRLAQQLNLKGRPLNPEEFISARYGEQALS